MLLYTDDVIAERIRHETSFEPAVRNALERSLSPGGTVIDIGANIGYYAIIAARHIGCARQVLAFEPQPNVVAKLRENLALNNLTNVEVLPYALSDQNGTALFYFPESGQESLGGFRQNGRFQSREASEVRTARLDDVLDELGNPHISLIKMDAEGAELQIINGAERLLSSPNRPTIIFEAFEENVRSFGHSVFDLLSRIHSFGYELTQLDREDWIAIPARSAQ
jgi:FkbM family methyltransferase